MFLLATLDNSTVTTIRKQNKVMTTATLVIFLSAFMILSTIKHHLSAYNTLLHVLAHITNSIYPPTHRHGVGAHIVKRRGTRAGRLHRIWHGKLLLCSEAVPSLPPTLPKQMEEDIHTISTVGNVTIGLLNAQSSVKKAIPINDLIIEKSLDIMIITETWRHDGGDEPAIREMRPTGYVFFQKPRSTGQRGGGLAVYQSINLH